MAGAACAGMDPMTYFRADSDIERALILRLALKAIELHSKYREDQARRIIGALDRALKKKGSGKQAGVAE